MKDLSYESDFTPQDLKKAMTYNAYFRMRFTVPLLILIVLIGIVGLIWIHALNTLSVLFLLCLAYPIYFVVSTAKKINSAAKDPKLPKNVRQRILLSDEQVVCARNGKFDHYEWENVDSARESKEFFYLYLESGRVLVLPKRDVSSDTALETRNLLTDKLLPAKVHLRKDMI